MPCIVCNVNIKIPENKKESIKTRLGKAIELIPGKSEKWLMIIFNDECKMYFQGVDNFTMAFVEIKMLIKKDVNDSYYSLASNITETINEELNIDPNHIYIKFDETSFWGFNGKIL